MQQFGVIGLSVMGKNLALNIKSHGFSVAAFSIDKPEVDAMQKYADDSLLPVYTWEDLVKNLEKPRKILVMIQAGKPVDLTLDKLSTLLEPGDIVIDGGNSNYHDTNRRVKAMKEKGIDFIGMGVSGGETGALNGPALMPGGDEAAYKRVQPIVEAIAAKTDDGRPCVSYIGPEGSGHYVKMVHNGIEYAIMQVLAEVYDLMRTVGHMDNKAMSQTFADWYHDKVDAYLVEISAKVLAQKDDLTDDDVIDHILNVASYKGTGNWMLEDGIVLGAPISMIAEAVIGRFMSKQTLRLGQAPVSDEKVPDNFVSNLQDALNLAQAVAYAQGFGQLHLAAEAYDWDLRYSAIAQNWEAGCIIRSGMLKQIEKAFDNAKAPVKTLFQTPEFAKQLKDELPALRKMVALGAQAGVPVPTLSAALTYLDSIFNPRLPQNLIQGQRDYFGAHTYLRNDREGVYHTEWYEEK
ncbi:MAG: NADP-dependent phosphogluconate dehydrogenase [Lactobacillus sp.]|nr:NADP-dependent phosphogluconate dehydrogenase [Lactobacillus sp.]